MINFKLLFDLDKEKIFNYYNNLDSKIEKVNYSKIEIEFDYEQTSNVHHFLSKHNASNIENKFEDIPRIICLVKPDRMKNLKSELAEVSRGSINMKELEKNIFI